ncbi:MAG TPA: tetratricopeptide repeat protein, partial [Phototrophicaceae bacterium]|nr:tetratricopeptide repeat protein [Phototrophicaceae bacterium]
VLIVLDNVETSDQAEPLLPPSGVGAVLLTSRRHDLAVTRSARRFQIGPFEQVEDSLALFAGLLGVEPARQEREPLLEIADQLGHLPLALDIAASRMAHEPSWSAADFLARLRREESCLAELVYENQNVRLSFNTSYQLLSAEQQQVFRALGVFGGEDFSLEAAAYVVELSTDRTADFIRSLYGLSLVQLGHSGRYRLHPLLRELALAETIQPVTWQRMVTFFVQYLETHREDYPALDAESPNLFAALETAFERQLNALLVRGADALATYLDQRGLYSQAERHLSRAIAAAQTLGDQAAQASLLHRLGVALIYDGKVEAAEQHLKAGLELTRQTISQQNVAAMCSAYLGLIVFLRGNYAQMETYLWEALVLAREINADEAVCRTLEGLAGIAERRGDYATAEAYCREAVDLAHRLENRELLSLRLTDLAHYLFERGGDYSEVSAHIQNSRILALESGHPRVIRASLITMSYILCQHGDLLAAEACLQEADHCAYGNDYPAEQIRILSIRGLVNDGRQRYTEALDNLHEALTLTQQVGIPVYIPSIQNALGQIHLKQQTWAAAAEAFTTALVISRQLGICTDMAQALYGLARVAAAQGDWAEARRQGEESLAIFETAGHRTRAEVRAWLAELD